MQAPILGHIYPFAFTTEGLERLWLGDLANVARWRDSPVVRLWAIAVTAIGYLGLWLHLGRGVLASAASMGERVRRSLVPACLVGLASAPLAIAARDHTH